MRICFIVNPVFDGWSPADTRLGGSEECVVNWARRLKDRGHDVTVYHNGTHGTYNGVPYRDRLDYLKYSGNGITVNVNYPDLDPVGKTVFWSTLDKHRGFDVSRYDAVLAISNYQAKHTDLKGKVTDILSPGYDSKAIYYDKTWKIPGQVLYASSPDRGLRILEDVWPEVVKDVDYAQLIVTYNGQIEGPNILCMGDVDESMMTDLYNTSTVWVHPAINGELYCMTGVKAQAAGCIPVVFPTMALNETVKEGFFCNPGTLADALIDALTDSVPWKQHKFPDWESTTDELEQILYNIDRRTSL